MTNLEKPLSRLCPGIADGQGRELTVTIQPSGSGGELVLHWNGDRKKTGDRTFQFEDLSKAGGGAPAGWGTWIRTEDVKSHIMISPGIPHPMKSELCKLVDRIPVLLAWAASDSDVTKEQYLEERGALELLELGIDKPREAPAPDTDVKTEKREAVRKQRLAVAMEKLGLDRIKSKPAAAGRRGKGRGNGRK